MGVAGNMHFSSMFTSYAMMGGKDQGRTLQILDWCLMHGGSDRNGVNHLKLNIETVSAENFGSSTCAHLYK